MDDPTFAARNNMATTVNDNYNAAALLTPEEDLGISPSARRTLSAQRVAVVMNSDGSIAKPHSDVQVRPHAPIRPSEAELHHPTVAAPAYDTSSSTNTAVSAPGNKQEGDVTPPLPPPPPQLAGAPVDADAIYESEVTKKPEDDLRVADVEELTKKGINLDSRGVIINGLTREDVWALLRRFDKQIRHVREIEAPKKGRLDLKTAADDQFAPEKLRANLERLYLTVVLSLVSLSKHLGRLSNWEDQYRTATFCVAYFVFWFFNLLIPAFLTLLAVLIAVPPARTILFPPTKLAVVHPYDGGNAPALPANGEIHSDDTLTGAPEVQKGEAAELEASNFVSGIAMVAVGAASGTGEQSDSEYESPSEKSRDHGDDKPGAVPDPTELASKTTNAIGTAESGRKLHTKEDKTKQPMANAAWEYSKVAMHVIGMICDTWEKLGNALSPTPPFHKNRLRERLAVMLVPLIFLTPYVTYNMIFGGISFGIGVGFFGQKWLVPAGQQGLEWLNTNYPNWPEWFDIANRFLRSAPTNAQLTLTLLRIAESQNAPLPPPPSTAPSNHIPPAAQGHGPNFQKGNDEEAELESSYIDTSEQQEQVSHQDSPKKASTKSKLVGLLRGTAKIGAGTVEGTHRLKAATVGGDVREKVGVLPPRVVRGHPAADGPNSFFARHHGRKGHVILDIDTSAGGPAAAHILFEPGREDGSKTKPATIEIEVSKISEIRKVGGLGWKGKLVAGWALGEDVPDGIEITLRSGEKFMFTAMPRRDELFDRLVAMSGQRWESL